MIICDHIDLVKNGEFLTTLRVYMKGSGIPSDEHSIVGLSIEGHGIGDIHHQEIGEHLESTWTLE